VFDTPITSSDQSIDRVLAAGLPVLIVFFEGPVPEPFDQVMKRLARENEGQALVVKINTRDNPGSTARFQVSRYPAVVIYKGGEVLALQEAASSGDLEGYMAYLLGKGPKPQAITKTIETGSPASRSSNGRSAERAGYASTSAPRAPVNVTDGTFEQNVMRSTLPVLVDFWAPWCGPCRMTEPVLEKLSREMTGKLVIAKVNVDENPSVAQRYGIQSIPTMMVVKNGQIVDRWMGALPEANIRSRLSALRL
jgi:thioredoxin 1